MAISWWHGESNDFAYFTGKSRHSLASTWHCETGAKNGPRKNLFGFLAHFGSGSRRAGWKAQMPCCAKCELSFALNLESIDQ